MKQMKHLLSRIAMPALCVALGFSGCNLRNSSSAGATNVTTPAKDHHTLSNADSIAVTHLWLDIAVSLDQKNITGSATWTISNTSGLSDLRLDTWDLTIDSVQVDGVKAVFRMDAADKYLGSALHIPIAAASAKVQIWYKTGKKARALQWLDPEQTHDKKYPFLFTQSESIYARSWIPCPDGPGIRFTYDARVKAPAGMLALMSAENPQVKNDSAIYHFRMEQPIPAYLMALAVGDIVFDAVDARTGVYAEPGMIQSARWELADMGKMVNTAEHLYGPYRWGRYDVIVLPPSFPIGGMENPRLTFSTPTIMAGDRSLVSLIAHELAHSWSGNLVTNATWNDFWLNEGFTNYFERRIMESMEGSGYSDMLWNEGYEILVDAVRDMKDTSRDTKLSIELNGRDPDDGFSDIPYEKGSLFLRLIENNVGRARFDTFLNRYFNEHAFKTMTTAHFLAYLDSNLIKGDTALQRKLDIKAWVYGTGIPANCPKFNPVRLRRVDSETAVFPVAKESVKGWSTHEWLYFLHKITGHTDKEQMKKLDEMYHLTLTGNSEIAFDWFMMALKAHYEPAYGKMEEFLSHVGRRKFLEPLYKEMMDTPGDQDMARRIYAAYRKNYHPLAQESLDKMVK